MQKFLLRAAKLKAKLCLSGAVRQCNLDEWLTKNGDFESYREKNDLQGINLIVSLNYVIQSHAGFLSAE